MSDINTKSPFYLRDKILQDNLALCLSGGGYRAMMFHAGALWRLNDSGLLKKIKRISSVSGGSITAGALAVAWKTLAFNNNKVASNYVEKVVEPLRNVARQTIDAKTIIGGLLFHGSISSRIIKAYDKYLFDEKTLQDLPDDNEGPRFVFNASSLQTGCLWRFSKPYMAEYSVGLIENPTLKISQAVAASSAFPPVLSPVVIHVDPASFKPGSEGKNHKKPYTSRLVLGDGGIYDNLGLETILKKYKRLLVSDAGAKLKPQPKPRRNWISQSVHLISLIDNQVRCLRWRSIIDYYKSAADSEFHRDGAYWGIATNIADYEFPGALDCPQNAIHELANVKTRLAGMDERLQERLMNWGYAVCDAVIGKYYTAEQFLPRPGGFPYPGGIE